MTQQDLEIAMHGAKESMQIADMWLMEGNLEKAAIFMARANEFVSEVANIAEDIAQKIRAEKDKSRDS